MMTGIEETIYKDYEKSVFSEDSVVMSDKVQSMANGIYQEFERLIERYDASVVKNLMPLVVAVLENLDELEKYKRNGDVEVEMLREDNSALMNQYEREKNCRKSFEEKIMNLEYAFDDEKKILNEKIDQLESNVRMWESKFKNSTDVISRMEEKEKEQKNEYQKLHDRYTELIKSYAEQSEKLKSCHSNAGTMQRSFHGKWRKASNDDDKVEYEGSGDGENDIIDERSDNYRKYAQGQNDDLDLLEETLTNSMREDMEMENLGEILQRDGQESTPYNPESVEDDIQSEENYEHGSDGDEYIDVGFGREIENLIKENQELIETKNALNVVKDDLIKRLDFKTGENDLLKSELDSQHNRECDLKARLSNLELDFKEIRQQNETMKGQLENIDEPNDNKRFTRVEMAIVLKERNKYKERLFELEDTLRYTDMVRATRQHPEIMLDNPRQTQRGSSSSSIEVESSSSSNKNQKQTGIMDLFFGLLKKYEDGISMGEEKQKNVTGTDRPNNLNNESTKQKKCFIFKEDANRSQLYGWSVPKDLMQSTLSNQVPTPVASHSILEPKDSIICVTKSPVSNNNINHKSFIWVIVERPKREHIAYFLAQFSLSSRNEITPNNISYLKIPKKPRNILAVPEISQIIEDRYSFAVDDFPSPAQSPSESPGFNMSDYVKVSKVHNTKAKLKKRTTDVHSKTLWINYDDGIIVIFSINSSNSFDGRLATLFLPGQIINMIYCQGRVFVALNDGCLCVFDLKSTNESWELNQCLIMEMSHSSPISALEDHRSTGTLWFGSDQFCYIIGVNNLNFRKSFQVNDTTNNEQHISRVECIYSSTDNQIMWISMTHVGRLFAFDSYNYSRLINIDFRLCLLDIIETVDKCSKFRFSFPIISEDIDRLWLGSNCGFIICLPKSQFNLSQIQTSMSETSSSDKSINPSQVYVSCHGFSGSLVNLVTLHLSTQPNSSLASTPNSNHSLSPTCKSKSGDTTTEQPITPSTITNQSPVIIALGSSYVNLNSSPSKVSIDDYINRNNVLIWKVM